MSARTTNTKDVVRPIRKARQAGLETSRLRRLAWHRRHRQDQLIEDPDDVG
jgi:hypothetical protein